VTLAGPTAASSRSLALVLVVKKQWHVTHAMSVGVSVTFMCVRALRPSTRTNVAPSVVCFGADHGMLSHRLSRALGVHRCRSQVRVGVGVGVRQRHAHNG
jgi:hypothetical protein